MDICYVPAGFLIVSGFLGAIFLGKPWILPGDPTQRFVRSIIVGVSTGLVVFNVLLILIASNLSGSCLNIYANPRIGIVACVSIPLGIIAMIGQYLEFKQMSWFDQIKNKIGENQGKRRD
jgi:hypothetical protein